MSVRYEDLEIARATEADYDAIVAVLDEAARWQVSSGIDQWTPGDWGWDWVGEPITRGWTYLVRRNGALVGTVSLEEEDVGIWDDASGREALYVHRLAALPPGDAKGTGRTILAWCEDQTRASGRRALRLDCPFGNARLRAYYERAGFALVDDRVLSGVNTDTGASWRYHAAKYEKKVAPTERPERGLGIPIN